jgi:hypothetical protein
VVAIYGSITLTCLLELCGKCRFQFLQWWTFQWLPLLGERSTVEKLLSVSSCFYTVGFRVDTESLIHEACSTCVPIYVYQHVLKYLLYHSCKWSRFSLIIHISSSCSELWPPLSSSGHSSWLQIQRSWVRLPALPDFLRSSGSGMGSTQPCEYNWRATWKK